jgi:hypothetical protein
MLGCMLTMCASGQEQKKPLQEDTAVSKPITIDPIFMSDRPLQLLPLSLELAATPGYYKSIIFQSDAASPYFFSRREVEVMDLATPWKLQLARENEHRTLYTILGAVQAGGVAYLAYKHIQKYGWK